MSLRLWYFVVVTNKRNMAYIIPCVTLSAYEIVLLDASKDGKGIKAQLKWC